MPMLRKFNERGIEEFRDMLLTFSENKQIVNEELSILLIDDSLTNTLDTKLVDATAIGTAKYDIAKYLSDKLALKTNPKSYYDRGLWSWLAAYFLEALVPVRRNTTERAFHELALYILEPNKWTKYYRHLLAFPTWIYSELGDKGKIFLRGEAHERGEIVEQLASVNDIQRNTSIVEAASLLYYDVNNDLISKGAASKAKPGTARRFRDVIQQLKLTYDLNAMTGMQIVSVLPSEFDDWHKLQQGDQSSRQSSGKSKVGKTLEKESPRKNRRA
jgi:hypothetical protein